MKIKQATIPPTYKTTAHLNQAAPVQNTYYTILNTSNNVHVKEITGYVATTGETLQVKVTIDGVTLTSNALAIANDTFFYAYLGGDGSLQISTTQFSQYRTWLLVGRSVKVEIQKTTAAGAGNLHGYVQYNQDD